MNTVFFTGAGISASAGIPTYREGGSSWRDPELEKKSHATRYGNHLDELWTKHWGPVQHQMMIAEPTHAHKAIADNGGVVITQNIDDLHERAGSDKVYHLHGSLEARCLRCKSHNVFPWTESEGAPTCINCGSNKTRPNVVLFGEMLSAKMFREVSSLVVRADNFVVVGSSLNVYPAASLVMDNVTKTTMVNKDRVGFSPWFKNGYYGNADDLIDQALAEL